MKQDLTKLIDKALSRRSFLAGAGAVTAGAVLAGCSDDGSTSTSTPTTPTTPTTASFTDVDYLNFALNLEYLEAEFYLHAATGAGLSSADSGNATSKTTVGASTQIPGLTATQMAYINEIAQNELDHVRLLRSALGSSAVAAPTIDLSTSFGALAKAAGLPSTFTPFDNYNDYLIGAFIFEDVGVTAYHGAAPALTDKTHLTAAAEIHAVEAYHAGSIRAQIVAAGDDLIKMAVAVQGVRATLGGGMETNLSATTLVAADSSSIGYSRTPDQVLHIVYGTGGTTGVKGGVFFPNGLNGNISVTQS